MSSSSLPAKSPTNKVDRGYRTSLPALEFLKLEKESLERGITPFKLTAIIMKMYINGELVLVEENKGKK